MTNRIIEVLEEAGRFYFVEEKDEVINKMVQEWERSVSGLLEEELNVGKFQQLNGSHMQKFMTLQYPIKKKLLEEKPN